MESLRSGGLNDRIILIKENTMCKTKTETSRKRNRLLWAGMTTAALTLFAINPLFSQPVPSEKDIFVPPPGYAKFDSGQTQALSEFFKSMNQQIAKNMEAGTGFKVELRAYVFVCEKSVEDVAGYYEEKLDTQAEIETRPVFSSPGELEEDESESGFAYPEDFLDRYRSAYEKYGDVEQAQVEFETGNMDYAKGGTSVTIEIENPGVDFKTLSPLKKTVITYAVVKFSK
jgi:hypothetical protein